LELNKSDSIKVLTTFTIFYGYIAILLSLRVRTTQIVLFLLKLTIQDFCTKFKARIQLQQKLNPLPFRHHRKPTSLRQSTNNHPDEICTLEYITHMKACMKKTRGWGKNIRAVFSI